MSEVNPWSEIADLVANLNPHLAAFSSRSLPDADFRSMYACDMATFLASWIDDNLFGIKGLTSKRNPAWDNPASVIKFAHCLGLLITLSKNTRVLTTQNVNHIRSHVEAMVAGASELIPPCDGDEFPALFEYDRYNLRTTAYLINLVDACGLHNVQGTQTQLMVRFPIAVSAAMKVLSHAASDMYKKELNGDFLAPIRA